MKFIPLAVAAVFHLSPWPVSADETVKEKVEEVGQDTKKLTKRTARNIKDKGCEMVNGKMECAGQRIKNKAKSAGDEIKDKAEDVTE